MIRKYLLPLLAAVGVIFAVFTVVSGSKPTIPAQPVTQPSAAPFDRYIAGAGIIEASTENIQIGTPVAGIVSEILVDVGSTVKKDQPLFRIDSRELTAQLAVQQANLKSAQQAVKVAEATMLDDRNRLAMWAEITDNRAVSKEEIDTRRYAVMKSEASYAKAQADVAGAEASVGQIETEIERRIIRAPVDGTILQTKIRPGEFAQAGMVSTPLLVLGNVKTLHVRTDIDENDAWRLSKDAPAFAYVRGNTRLSTPLKLVRVEPYVIPKRSLTGDATERVDTRVLQVLYQFDGQSLPVYVGQQMDVYIEELVSNPTTLPAK